MYCTGGIRCDVYSAKLRQQGFSNMFTLAGGVQAYLRDEGDSKWEGELFVFDDRLATPNMPKLAMNGMKPHVGDRPCFCCQQPIAAPPHHNCANVDCNRLFLCVPFACVRPARPLTCASLLPRMAPCAANSWVARHLTMCGVELQRVHGVYAAASGPLQRRVPRLCATQAATP
jgi:hypothetical protein